MKLELQNIAETSLSIIYPRHCPVCDGLVKTIEIKDGKLITGRLLHEACNRKVKRISGNTCVKCGKLLGSGHEEDEYCYDCTRTRHFFDRGFSVFEYRSISGSIYRFKYMGRQEYATFYGREIKKKYGDKLRKLGIEAIIPVPMYKNKEVIRGYNQAAVLAESISKLINIPVYRDVVVRTRNTKAMKELDARGRRNNLKKAFNIARNDVKFKCILIIDDIYTTGSTIDEIAHEFRIAGVKKIYCLSLAIGQTT
ncbi:MAG: ComF family protein [Butyrivibrio sp.]|nr:ComF family protein [Butyrivibrio sp.]